MSTVLRKFLMISATLVVFADIAAAQENATVATPPTIGSELPFTNNGANQPVLETMSNDNAVLTQAAPATPKPAHAADEHKGLPQFNPKVYSKQIVWLFITFGILYFFFSKITLPNINDILDERENKISGDLREAQNLKTRVDIIHDEYEETINTAHLEAQGMIRSVQDDIKRLSETQEAAFKAVAENALHEIENRVKIHISRLEAELDSMTACIAVDIAKLVADIDSDKATAQKIVDDLTGHVKAA
jgi:F-type H+-transporting ATPase subunit b